MFLEKIKKIILNIDKKFFRSSIINSYLEFKYYIKVMIYAYIIWGMFAVLKKMKTQETINFLQLVINAETIFIINTDTLKDDPVDYTIMTKMIFVNVVIYIKKMLGTMDVFI